MKELEIVENLNEIKKQIDEAEREVGILAGRLEENMSRLEKDFDLKSEKETEKFISNLTKRIEQMKEEIQTKYDKLKENYDW